MVLEGAGCNDPEARTRARVHLAAEAFIRDSIAARYAQHAGPLADFVCTTMARMSASARHGQSLERLLATARLAGVALEQAIPG